MFRPLYALAVCLGLAACAPAPAARLSVAQLSEAPTYYPHPTGAVWSYLPEGEAENAPVLVQRAEGPTLIDGRTLTAWHATGRGFDTRTYRDYRGDGVFIPRETGPGYVTTITPAIREWPRERTLKVGSSWGGEAVAEINFTDAGKREKVRLEYRYEVVDKRPVTTPAGTFEVFVVSFESRSYGESGETQEVLRQEVWFAPFIGEVKTDTGLFLLQTNLLPEDAAPVGPATAPENPG